MIDSKIPARKDSMPTPKERPLIVRFGPYLANSAKREFTKEGIRILGPKASCVRALWTWLPAAVGISVALSASMATLHSQTLCGIRGTVTDQSQLAVSDARVFVANSDTGVRRNTETNGLGSYYITDLIPGAYTVSVEKPGFKSSVQNNVLVQAATRSEVN